VSNLYIPARITDRVWAEKFVEGQIFMRSLTEFGAWEAVQRYTKDELNNSFRGDLREGTVKVVANPDDDNFFSTFPEELKMGIKHAAILDVGDIQYFNILCLCCIDYMPELRQFISPSKRMKEFGDAAVIIKDMNEFLLRLMKGIEKIGKKVCLLMEKVEYYSFDETKILNPLFNKKQDHEYQNELRIAIGRLDLNKPTSDDKYELCTSTEPLKVEIGDISDITIVLPIDDFCAFKRLDSAIFPMIDRRSDIFNRLLKETQETMSRFESRKQTFTFDI